MVFVTVGTHEQPFNRLVEAMDQWAAAHDEPVVMQTGFSTYEPKHCRWQKLFPYQEMARQTQEARIVITHGGPSSFIMPLQYGKVPIVVPRQKAYDEHVNDHQVDFCHQIARRQGNIIVVEDTARLEEIIADYDAIAGRMAGGLNSNNAKFCRAFAQIVEDLLG